MPALIDQLRLHSIYMQPFQTGLRKVPLTEPVKYVFDVVVIVVVVVKLP